MLLKRKSPTLLAKMGENKTNCSNYASRGTFSPQKTKRAKIRAVCKMKGPNVGPSTRMGPTERLTAPFAPATLLLLPLEGALRLNSTCSAASGDGRAKGELRRRPLFPIRPFFEVRELAS